MDITWEGLLFVWKLMLLSWLVGFWLTSGFWAFCKAFKWAPIIVKVVKSDVD